MTRERILAWSLALGAAVASWGAFTRPVDLPSTTVIAVLAVVLLAPFVIVLAVALIPVPTWRESDA